MRVVVVGAGIVGLCSAWYLRRDGHAVTVVDRGAPDGDKCSVGNAGILVPSHFIPLAAPGMVAEGVKMLAKRDSPFRIKPSLDPDLARWCLLFMRHCTHENVHRASPLLRDMHVESKALYLRLSDDLGGSFGLTQKGMLMLCRTEEGLKEEADVAARAHELGLRAEVLEASEVRARDAGVSEDVVGAVHFLDDCHLAPHTLVEKLRAAAESKGVEFRWSTDVSGLDASGDGRWRIATEQGNLDADWVVVTGGSWSGRLAKGIGLDLPLQPGKGQSVMVRQPAARPLTAMLLKEARVAVTPLEEGVRFGGTMELGEWSVKPDRTRSKAMLKRVPDYLPGFAASSLVDLDVWAGLRPCSPDGLPYIGTTSVADGIVFATGHGMMGVSLGPVTGKLVTEIIAGTRAVSPLLSPDRFCAAKPGNPDA